MIPRLFRSCRSLQTLGKTLTPPKRDPSTLSRTFSSKSNDGDDEKKFPPDGFSVNKDAGTYKKWSFSSEIESEDGKFDFFGKIQDPGENNVPRFEEEPLFRRPESSYERGVVSVEEEWTGGKGDDLLKAVDVDWRVKDQGISRGDEEEMREGFETWNLEEKSEDWALGKVFEDLHGEEEGSGDLSEGVERGTSELAKQYAEEEASLTAILKGRSHAFGDLIAASGITEEMLDSYLKDLKGVQPLPPMSVIDEIRKKEGEEKSTGQEIEYKKQEELSKSRVRVVDEKGRAYGTGRRKCSVARVWIQPGEGEFIVNDKSIDVYFPILDHRAHLLQPFSETKTIGMWDVRCSVKGGGVSGQAGAIRLGISRALQNWEPGFRPDLRSAGLLTRDSRAVERKKPGKAKARKSFQWVKR